MKRYLLGAVALHVVFAAIWIRLDGTQLDEYERWATAIGETVAGVFFAAMVIAFGWARKSRLNTAFAIQKAYWTVLVFGLALPLQWGLIVHRAPYQKIVIPYVIWVAPAWLRVYVWTFMPIATIGVLYEFWRANWGQGRHVKR